MNRRVLVLAAALAASCGVVGPPIPPENVGVALTIEEQKKRDAGEARPGEAAGAAGTLESDPALQGQDVILPPLRPVGTR